ncbi:MAG: diaminopimelate epimerase [Planctomycetaceae bacterium]
MKTALPFIKMHGAGNDYVLVDGFETTLPPDPAAFARQISNRNFAVGSDGLVYLIPPTDGESDVLMRMWNADGSEGSMCGNAARCIALWMHFRQRTARVCRIATPSAPVVANVLSFDAVRATADVSLRLSPPAFGSGDEDVLEDLRLPGQQRGVRFTSVSIGNPHAVVFVDELDDELVNWLGPRISEHARFPDGVNVEFVRVVARDELVIRVWERGSGETLACGSGACAAVVSAIRLGICPHDTAVTVRLPGGILSVCWNHPSNSTAESLTLTGPATISFQGSWATGG